MWSRSTSKLDEDVVGKCHVVALVVVIASVLSIVNDIVRVCDTRGRLIIV